MSEIEKNLLNLGIKLPKAPKAMGNFLPYLLDGPLLIYLAKYLST
jgi:hypothetical protein